MSPNQSEVNQRTYNERLFSGGFRKWLHNGRFLWMSKQLSFVKFEVNSVLEIGCYDARSIEFMPVFPKRYVGYDANWENGLQLGKEKWKGYNNVSLKESQKPEDIVEDQNFDVAISLETFEHILTEQYKGYFQKIKETKPKLVLISVPMEIGPLFLLKHLAKIITGKYYEKYSVKEVIYNSIGLSKQVKRIERTHKGFDYRNFKKMLDQSFSEVKMVGIPFSKMPTWLNFAVGFKCKTIN